MNNVSVIISIRNRDSDRLAACLSSLRQNSIGKDIEIIVSDFGSDNHISVRDVASSYDAQYIYTESTVWNKARALNKGFELARGEILISLDVDMVVAPQTIELVRDAVQPNPSSCVVLQSRDLPPSIAVEDLLVGQTEWSDLDIHSNIRARWGIGGLFACTRSTAQGIGGLDERMIGWGAEDLDFAKRCQHAGARITWLNDPRARIYHVWHPSAQQEAEKTEETRKKVEHNRSIYYEDSTVVRNSTTKAFDPKETPLVSVIMCTFNRGNLIKESIYSVLAQSVSNFELIIVNDGSTDDTESVVGAFTDARIRLFTIENLGIAAARNFGTKQARGRFIAVHDDDDLMIPNRLESSLSEMKSGIGATYGSLINFNDQTGDMKINVTRSDFGERTIPGSSAAPGHATWLVRAELMKATPYDENQSSAVDNNLAIRLAAGGVRWKHTGNVHLMRRQHDGQITNSDFGIQSANARAAQTWLRTPGSLKIRGEKVDELKTVGWPKGKAPNELIADSIAWLPDHLVRRSVVVLGEGNLDKLDGLDSSVIRGEIGLRAASNDGNSEITMRILDDARWPDLAQLRQRDFQFELLRADLRGEESTEVECDREQTPLMLGESLMTQLGIELEPYSLLTVSTSMPSVDAKNRVFSWWSNKVDSVVRTVWSFDDEITLDETIEELVREGKSSVFKIGMGSRN